MEKISANKVDGLSVFGLSALFILFGGLGCMSPSYHSQRLHSTNERAVTVGIVQKEITVGMLQSDVAVALGSPNIVTRDAGGKETWVYDKIATEASYSHGSGGVGGLVGGGGPSAGGLVLGLVSGSYRESAGATATTQRTLTVLIKFGTNGLVETFSYHGSKF